MELRWRYDDQGEPRGVPLSAEEEVSAFLDGQRVARWATTRRRLSATTRGLGAILARSRRRTGVPRE